MSEPRFNVSMGNGAERVCQGIQQRIELARLRRPQCRLDFRPAQFNGIEVRRIGRQEGQARPAGFDELTRVCALVRREVIQQDNIATPHSRDENPFDVEFERHAVHSPFQEPRSLHAVPAQSSDQGVVRSRIAGYGFHDAPPWNRTPKPTGQAQIHAAFIDKFQVLEQGAEFLRPAFSKFLPQTFDARRFPFARVERLFFAADPAAPTRGTSCSDLLSPVAG